MVIGASQKRKLSPYFHSNFQGVTTLLLVPGSNCFMSSQVMLQFPTPTNATSLEALYKVNCSNLSCSSNTTIVDNITTNNTFLDIEDREPLTDLILMGVLSIVLGLMILVTVIGNVFVIAAILLERNLQNVANYLIVSLAVADLMVACLVMPLGAVYVISNNWIMGPELCDMWTSIDVLCSSASILHLVAIAVDRYWAVTNVDYIHTRNSYRIGVMIIIIWTIALVVSLSPQIPQFKDPDYLFRINEKKQCLVSQDVKYQIFATSSTFYVPLLMIFILYWKIFQTARKRIRRRREINSHNSNKPHKDKLDKVDSSQVHKSFLSKRKFLRFKKNPDKQSSAAEALVNTLMTMEGQSTTTTMELMEDTDDREKSITAPDVPKNLSLALTETQSTTTEQKTTAFTISKATDGQNNVYQTKAANNGSAADQSETISRAGTLSKELPSCPASVDKLLPSKKEKKESLEAKRERKAAKTLAIITGAFVMCWLPFFILALLLPLCGDACNISGYIMSFALWLGYFNSTLNPVIYTIFSPEFRQAFKRILCGGHRGPRTYRSGKMR
ncbi:5-hydroxytryptamine receptor-like [Diorhabda carinulata]|uniref:5-hydroxytryptamine receptor-like n=1 Tax=Diorhabda carinulata TaxID=1163345 RepID=UPI0025A07FF5|nr:5-hydroxytryptamine receptor-like [Diorhabda carinulata]XP_057666042.1 5-hydroxytryptamine receptor-like [Diorhabda carinulata]XP_057666043.1 5-hydroxytryptamine receptor-like [Diorhabda carinulata]XP_057666045.1 5-hydroxytryptamine receptor-like [Diorhabda carinulata]